MCIIYYYYHWLLHYKFTWFIDYYIILDDEIDSPGDICEDSKLTLSIEHFETEFAEAKKKFENEITYLKKEYIYVYFYFLVDLAQISMSGRFQPRYMAGLETN